VACRGGADGPRHPPWGHPRGQFSLKRYVNDKKEEKNVVTDRDESSEAGRSKIAEGRDQIYRLFERTSGDEGSHPHRVEATV